MVRVFHERAGIHACGGCGPKMPPDRRELRAELIREEAAETVAAIKLGLLSPTVDGLCDILYVTYGAALEFGVDLELPFKEVHLSNLAKLEGQTERADGKILKPEGWVAPDIAGILQTGRGRYVG